MDTMDTHEACRKVDNFFYNDDKYTLLIALMFYIWQYFIEFFLSISNLGSNGKTSKVEISDKPCSINDEPGICIFTTECFKRKGMVLGTCRDGFLFGACCSINPNASIQADLMPNKADPQVILNKIDMLIDKLKPTVKVNSSSISSNNSSLSTNNTDSSDSLSGKNTTKLMLAQVDSSNIDSMTHSIVENVLEHFDSRSYRGIGPLILQSQ